jgi:hypothetical protein
MRAFVVALALLLVAAGAHAAKDEDFGGGSVVFAHGTALWKTDPKGKGPETELVTLPGNATDVRMIRSNPDGSIVIFELAGVWWSARLDPAATAPVTPEQLPCAAGEARFASDGSCILCAAENGETTLISMKTGKSTTKAVPPAGARVVVVDGVRRLIWADADGVWSAKVKNLDDKIELAPDAPVSGFLAAPDGSRGVAIYPGHLYEKKVKVEADVLSGFKLDGTAARRMLFPEGTVIDWSWDSTWLLVQNGEKACIARAVGGEYKCWKGYTAQSLAPDGRWALVRGTDSGKLLRVRLEGAQTEKPSLVQTEVDGAALWLPGVAEPTVE